VRSGNREAIAKLPMRDLEKILAATLTGTIVEQFSVVPFGTRLGCCRSS
jgi:hypothetical protein